VELATTTPAMAGSASAASSDVTAAPVSRATAPAASALGSTTQASVSAGWAWALAAWMRPIRPAPRRAILCMAALLWNKNAMRKLGWNI